MNSRSKVGLTICLAGLAVGVFVMATQNANMDSIMAQWRNTSNGSYVREIAVARHSEAVENLQSVSKPSINMPTSLEYSDIAKTIMNSSISTARKTICLEAIDTVEKGCIYHQLRSGVGAPSDCGVSGCDGTMVGDYDFKSQADYRIEDPLYLDCSFFVKHCYWKAGFEMISSNTSSMYDSKEFHTISADKLVPGDIAVRKGHAMIYLGDGVWAEMQNHKQDASIGKRDPVSDGRYVLRRFKALGGG